MGRSPCCSKVGLNRGQWTAVEDKILTSYIKVHGEGRWRNLPKKAGLKRCGKSCRLRWVNYLKPDIKRGNITPDEEDLILRLHWLLGNRWSLIAGRLPGRTDNEIKNYWNTKFAKKSNPPSRQSNRTSPSTATDVLKPLPTKATRPQVLRPQAVRLSSKFSLINSNASQPLRKSFDLHRNAVNVINNYQDSELPIFQRDDRVSTAYYSSDDLGLVDFENNKVDDPFPVSNLLSIENFLMEDCMIGNVNRSAVEYEIINDGKDMESSLDMFLNAEEWL